jgi:hypothetical protein
MAQRIYTQEERISFTSQLTEKERFCLQAYLVTKDKRMAFVCSREKPLKVDAGEGFRVNLSKWFNSDKVQSFIQEHQTQVRADAIDRGIDNLDIGKAELVRELTILFRNEKDPKLKADIGMKLADLQQMKKEQTEQDEQIKYYLPLQCSSCALYLKEKGGE